MTAELLTEQELATCSIWAHRTPQLTKLLAAYEALVQQVAKYEGDRQRQASRIAGLEMQLRTEKAAREAAETQAAALLAERDTLINAAAKAEARVKELEPKFLLQCEVSEALRAKLERAVFEIRLAKEETFTDFGPNVHLLRALEALR